MTSPETNLPAPETAEPTEPNGSTGERESLKEIKGFFTSLQDALGHRMGEWKARQDARAEFRSEMQLQEAAVDDNEEDTVYPTRRQLKAERKAAKEEAQLDYYNNVTRVQANQFYELGSIAYLQFMLKEGREGPSRRQLKENAYYNRERATSFMNAEYWARKQLANDKQMPQDLARQYEEEMANIKSEAKYDYKQAVKAAKSGKIDGLPTREEYRGSRARARRNYKRSIAPTDRRYSNAKARVKEAKEREGALRAQVATEAAGDFTTDPAATNQPTRQEEALDAYKDTLRAKREARASKLEAQQAKRVAREELRETKSRLAYGDRRTALGRNIFRIITGQNSISPREWAYMKNAAPETPPEPEQLLDLPETYKPRSPYVSKGGLEAFARSVVSPVELFSSPSVNAGHIERLRENTNDPMTPRYGKALERVIDEEGVDTILDIVEQSGRLVTHALHAIGLNPSTDTMDGSWAVLNIGKQVYTARHPEDAPRNTTPLYNIADTQAAAFHISKDQVGAEIIKQGVNQHDLLVELMREQAQTPYMNNVLAGSVGKLVKKSEKGSLSAQDLPLLEIALLNFVGHKLPRS